MGKILPEVMMNRMRNKAVVVEHPELLPRGKSRKLAALEHPRPVPLRPKGTVDGVWHF